MKKLLSISAAFLTISCATQSFTKHKSAPCANKSQNYVYMMKKGREVIKFPICHHKKNERTPEKRKTLMAEQELFNKQMIKSVQECKNRSENLLQDAQKEVAGEAKWITNNIERNKTKLLLSQREGAQRVNKQIKEAAQPEDVKNIQRKNKNPVISTFRSLQNALLHFMQMPEGEFQSKETKHIKTIQSLGEKYLQAMKEATNNLTKQDSKYFVDSHARRVAFYRLESVVQKCTQQKEAYELLQQFQNEEKNLMNGLISTVTTQSQTLNILEKCLKKFTQSNGKIFISTKEAKRIADLILEKIPDIQSDEESEKFKQKLQKAKDSIEKKIFTLDSKIKKLQMKTPTNRK